MRKLLFILFSLCFANVVHAFSCHCDVQVRDSYGYSTTVYVDAYCPNGQYTDLSCTGYAGSSYVQARCQNYKTGQSNTGFTGFSGTTMSSPYCYLR